MNRLTAVGLAVLAVAAGLGFALRGDPGAPAAADAPAPPPTVRVEADLGAAGLHPYRLAVPKDHRVELIVRAAADAPEGRLVVTGYEDRIPPVAVGPGLSREIVFVSDRPGDDFGFTIGGELVGRLHVTGSHLEEGHR